jgi:hypothetical protein
MIKVGGQLYGCPGMCQTPKPEPTSSRGSNLKSLDSTLARKNEALLECNNDKVTKELFSSSLAVKRE